MYLSYYHHQIGSMTHSLGQVMKQWCGLYVFLYSYQPYSTWVIVASKWSNCGICGKTFIRLSIIICNLFDQMTPNKMAGQGITKSHGASNINLINVPYNHHNVFPCQHQPMNTGSNTMLTHWGWNKMAPFSRWHFPMNFLEWKCMNFN